MITAVEAVGAEEVGAAAAAADLAVVVMMVGVAAIDSQTSRGMMQGRFQVLEVWRIDNHKGRKTQS